MPIYIFEIPPQPLPNASFKVHVQTSRSRLSLAKQMARLMVLFLTWLAEIHMFLISLFLRGISILINVTSFFKKSMVNIPSRTTTKDTSIVSSMQNHNLRSAHSGRTQLMLLNSIMSTQL